MEHVGDPGKADANVKLSPQDIVASPGDTVTLNYAGSVWHVPNIEELWQSGNFSYAQLIIGLEDRPLKTVCKSLVRYPGMRIRGSLSFKAPDSVGKYNIFGMVVTTLGDASPLYVKHPELRFQLGTLTVFPLHAVLVGAVGLALLFIIVPTILGSR